MAGLGRIAPSLSGSGFGVFVDCRVRQVLEQVAAVAVCGRQVLVRGEPGQSVFVNVDSQRVDRSNQHVNSHVEFQPVDEKGVFDVLLDDEIAREGHLFYSLGEGNASAFRTGIWFDDVELVGLFAFESFANQGFFQLASSKFWERSRSARERPFAFCRSALPLNKFFRAIAQMPGK